MRVAIEEQPTFARALHRLATHDRHRVQQTLFAFREHGLGTVSKHKNPASAEKFGFNATLRCGLWRIALLFEGGVWRVTDVLRRDDRRIYG